MLSQQLEDFLQALSSLTGILYVLAWSLSFYPQPYLNHLRRSTRGLTPDFPFLNVLGFSCYTASTAAFLFSPAVRDEYAARHPRSPEPTVRWNDLAFGVHAVAMCAVVYSQFWPRVWGWEIDGRAVRRVGWGTWVVVVWAVGWLGWAFLLAGWKGGPRGIVWLDVVYAISYVKLVLTVFKYVPQVVANFRRRSTVGWSITQQLLDFSGGILSLLQLVIDSGLQADWSGLVGNPVKLGLANISLAFDIVFILQHYVLYGPVEEKHSRDDDESGRSESSLEQDHDQERDRLLPGSREAR